MRKIISLFSGAGGMDLGIIRAGFEVVWANDFDAELLQPMKKYWQSYSTWRYYKNRK